MRSMSEDGTWADEIGILATSHILGRAILVISLNENTGKLYHTLYGQEEPNQKVIPVFYNGINHYELVDAWWLHQQKLGFDVFPVQTHEKALRNRYDAAALQNMAQEIKQIRKPREQDRSTVHGVMVHEL